MNGNVKLRTQSHPRVAALRTLAAALIWAIMLQSARAEEHADLVGIVSGVVDGDTVDVQLTSGLARVRLRAIDAPEKLQPYGQSAAAALAKLVLNKQVRIEPFEQDRYDRLVAIVYVDERSVNVQLVRQGVAWAYRSYMQRADAELCEYEAQARTAKIGLWADPLDSIEAPWQWRNKRLVAVTGFSAATETDCIAAIGR